MQKKQHRKTLFPPLSCQMLLHLLCVSQPPPPFRYSPTSNAFKKCFLANCLPKCCCTDIETALRHRRRQRQRQSSGRSWRQTTSIKNDANGSHCHSPRERERGKGRQEDRESLLWVGVLLPDMPWQLCHIRLIKNCMCTALIEAALHLLLMLLRSVFLAVAAATNLTAASVAKELYLSCGTLTTYLPLSTSLTACNLQ